MIKFIKKLIKKHSAKHEEEIQDIMNNWSIL